MRLSDPHPTPTPNQPRTTTLEVTLKAETSTRALQTAKQQNRVVHSERSSYVQHDPNTPFHVVCSIDRRRNKHTSL